MTRLLAALGCATLVLAAAADVDQALQAARARYPATDVRAVQETPLPGIYEYDMGGETVYGDATARYLILGRLVDMEDLPAPIDYDRVAAAGFLLQPGDAGEVVVFADPQCPYCEQLERRIAAGELAGYAVRVVVAPVLDGSYELARRVLCSPSPPESWRELVLAGVGPADCAGDLLAAHLDAVAAAGVTATPSLLGPGGRLYVGLPAAGQLRGWVQGQQRQ